MKKTTPPPLFLLEPKNDYEKGIQESVSRIARPIFLKAAKEMPKNLVLVGNDPKKQHKTSLYNPHDFRRYYKFFKVNFHPDNPDLGVGLGVGSTDYRVINSTELFYEDFYNCSLRVKTNQIQVTHKGNKWHNVVRNRSKKEIEGLTEQREKECVIVLKRFIKVFGGSSDFKILTKYSEDKVTNDPIVDKIPKKMKFRTPIVKKVYNERNIEFNDPIQAAQFIENSALMELTPDLLQELNQMKFTINPLLYLKQEFKAISDIFRLQDEINYLSKEQREEFGEWIFNKFGVMA